MKTKDAGTLLICIAIPLAIGAISGFATASNISDWYMTLEKPAWNPPNKVFGPVWTLLYVLMGLSFYMIWKSQPDKERSNAIMLFGIQLALNFAWSFIFFYFHAIGLALAEIILLWLSIIAMIIAFRKVHKTAALLQISYIAWVTFAMILNAVIWQMNR